MTFTTLIKGMLMVGKIQEAARLLEKLQSEQLVNPNEVTYLTMINGLCKAGHTLEAFDFLKLLEKGSCKPDVRAYTTLIHGLCNDGKIDDALRLFSTLCDKGISPDVSAYSSVIQGLCNLSRWNEDDGMLKKMDSNGVQHLDERLLQKGTSG